MSKMNPFEYEIADVKDPSDLIIKKIAKIFGDAKKGCFLIALQTGFGKTFISVQVSKLLVLSGYIDKLNELLPFHKKIKVFLISNLKKTLVSENDFCIKKDEDNTCDKFNSQLLDEKLINRIILLSNKEETVLAFKGEKLKNLSKHLKELVNLFKKHQDHVTHNKESSADDEKKNVNEDTENNDDSIKDIDGMYKSNISSLEESIDNFLMILFSFERKIDETHKIQNEQKDNYNFFDFNSVNKLKQDLFDAFNSLTFKLKNEFKSYYLLDSNYYSLQLALKAKYKELSNCLNENDKNEIQKEIDDLKGKIYSFEYSTLKDNFSWIFELYPDTYYFEKDIIILTSLKFLYGIAPFTGERITFNNLENNLIFLDEYDSNKAYFNKFIFSGTMKSKIDLIQFDKQLYTKASAHKCRITVQLAELFTLSDNSPYPKYYSALRHSNYSSEFDYFKDNISKFGKLYNLDFDYKYTDRKENEGNIIFNEVYVDKIVFPNKNFRMKLDIGSSTIIMYFSKDQESDSIDNENISESDTDVILDSINQENTTPISLMEFINNSNKLLSDFIAYLNAIFTMYQRVTYYFRNKSTPNFSDFRIKSYSDFKNNSSLYYEERNKLINNSVIDPNPTADFLSLLSSFFDDSELKKDLKSFAINRRGSSIYERISYFDSNNNKHYNYYYYGSRMYNIVVDKNHKDCDGIYSYNMNITAERIKAELCEKNLVVGLSASALIPSVISNFNPSYDYLYYIKPGKFENITFNDEEKSYLKASCAEMYKEYSNTETQQYYFIEEVSLKDDIFYKFYGKVSSDDKKEFLSKYLNKFIDDLEISDEKKYLCRLVIQKNMSLKLKVYEALRYIKNFHVINQFMKDQNLHNILMFNSPLANNSSETFNLKIFKDLVFLSLVINDVYINPNLINSDSVSCKLYFDSFYDSHISDNDPDCKNDTDSMYVDENYNAVIAEHFTVFNSEVNFDDDGRKNYKEQEDVVNRKLGIYDKFIVLTSYNTLETGANLKSLPLEKYKKDLIKMTSDYVKEGDGRLTYVDINAIYLGECTNLIPFVDFPTRINTSKKQQERIESFLKCLNLYNELIYKGENIHLLSQYLQLNQRILTSKYYHDEDYSNPIASLNSQKKGITKSLYKLNEVKLSVVKKIVQATGRISRSFLKYPTTKIFIDSNVFERADNFNYLKTVDFSLSPIMQAIVDFKKSSSVLSSKAESNNSCKSPCNDQRDYDNLVNAYQITNHAYRNYMGNLGGIFKGNSSVIDTYCKVRDFVLKHPTVRKTLVEKAESELVSSIKESGIKRKVDLSSFVRLNYLETYNNTVKYTFNKAFCSRKLDFKGRNVPLILKTEKLTLPIFDEEKSSSFVKNAVGDEGVVSLDESSTHLHAFVKNPVIKEYFERNNIPLSWGDKYDYIIPPAFYYFYTGVLGETVGKAILEHYIQKDKYKLNQLPLDIFERFDFVIGNSIFVDFKDYHSYLYSVSTKVFYEKVRVKLKEVKSYLDKSKIAYKKIYLFIINIMPNEAVNAQSGIFKRDISQDEHFELYEVQRLLLPNSEIDINSVEQIKQVLNNIL